MNLSQLRRMIEELPDETPIEIHNSGFEWYGLETLSEEAIKLIDGRLVITFGNRWNAYEEEQYRIDREKESQ